MSASLDKSLDDIISSSKPKKFPARKAKVGKKVGAIKKKPAVAIKKSVPKPVLKALQKKADTVDLSYATKVVVQGLPKDIKQEGIRVCIHEKTSLIGQ